MLKKILKFIIHYFYYLHLLIIAAFLYILIGLIWHYVSPASLAHWFWPDSYFIFQLLLFIANFFFFTFIFQNRRLGLWLALCIFSLLFFKFAHFAFTLALIFGLIVSFILLLLILWFYPLYRQKKLNQSQSAPFASSSQLQRDRQ